MRKRLKSWQVLWLCCILIGCGQPTAAGVSVVLSTPSCSLEQYTQITITATVTGSSRSVDWYAGEGLELSPDGNSVTVTGIEPGEYALTASAEGAKAVCVITVLPLPSDPDKADMQVGRLGETDGSTLRYDAAALVADSRVSSVTADGADLTDCYHTDERLLVLDEQTAEGLGLGEHTVTFVTDAGEKSFTLTVATLLIDTCEKFTSREIGLPAYWTNERIDTDPLKDGYFVLLRDLDFIGMAPYALNTDDDGKHGMPAGPYEYENSWFGTFDGRGHALKNITVDRYGLFAHIGKGAVVKNLALLNASVDVPSGNMGYLLAHGNDGVIDNCYLELTAFPTVPETGIFCRQVRFGGQVSNSIASLLTEDISGDAEEHAAIYHSGHADNMLSNVYFLRRGDKNPVINRFEDGQGVFGAFSFASDLLNAVERRWYDALEGPDRASASFDGFDVRYWTFDMKSGRILFGIHRVSDAEI